MVGLYLFIVFYAPYVFKAVAYGVAMGVVTATGALLFPMLAYNFLVLTSASVGR